MSVYDELDALVMKRIKLSANGVSVTEMLGGVVGQECQRISRLTDRDADRILKGRIQRLRELGVIKYSSKWGWQLT